VLRGKVVLAEVLASVGAVPLPPPVGFELEYGGEVNEPNKEGLIQWLIKELGEGNVQPYLARAYQPSLNTDLRPYKAAARLKDLTETLKDEGGLRVAALTEVVTRSMEKGLPEEEQNRAIETELKQNKPAGQWLESLAYYVNILNTEIGWTTDESVKFVMKKYGSKCEEQRVKEWVESYLTPTGS
jgi:hypothetical protein